MKNETILTKESIVSSTPTPTPFFFCRRSLKNFQCWQKGGTCTFLIFRGGVSKKKVADLEGGCWEFSESNFQLLIKYLMRWSLGKKRWGQYFRVGLIPWTTLWKGKTDTFFMSQTLVLGIKLATVNLIPYFGVSTVIILSHGYLPQVVQVELWTLAWKRWTAR